MTTAMTDETRFRRHMALVPELAGFARTISLPKTGVRLHAYDTGEAKPPLLLVHGLADESDSWRHVIPTLVRTHRVIAPDLPGFGRSDKPRRAYTIDFFRDTLLELLDVLGFDGVIYVGNSLGAMIGHWLTISTPARVRRLILVDGSLVITQRPTTLRGKWQAALGLAPILGERWYNSLRGRPDAAYATLAAYYADMSALPQTDRDFLYQRVNERVWDDQQRDAYFSTRRNTSAWFLAHGDLAARITALTTPTHVIWGEADRILDISNARDFIKIQPSANLTVLPGVGHLPQQEAPEAFLAALALG